MAAITQKCIPEIFVDPDKMSARLKLHKDEGGQELDVKDLKEIMGMKGVKVGFDDLTMEDMIENELYEVYIEVAKGKIPVKGSDGYFKFYVESVEEQRGPKEREDGSVEYVATIEHTIVEEGDLLAEYIPATFGEYGYTIDNAIRTPMRGKDLAPLRGKGFRIEDNKYYAQTRGKIDINERSIQITGVLEVKGDVDIAYGHIQFDGDVSIRGDVKSGMIVRATGNIDIRGHVGNSYVEAGKNINIGTGMQGKFSGRLKAGGDITSKFFENAQASADGNIYVRSVMNSKLEAQGKVVVEGKDSVVLGGSIFAVQGLDVTETGNASEVPTSLVAGVMAETKRRNYELTKLIKKVQDEVELLDKSARIIDRMTKTKATQDAHNRRMKIIQAKVIKSTELKKYQDEKRECEDLIRMGETACICIQKVIYPGCHVEIANRSIEVREKMKHVKFAIVNGDIAANLMY